MKKNLSFIKPYIVVVLIFITALLLIKTGETIGLLASKNLKSFDVFIRALAYTLIVVSFYSLIIFPLFLLLRLIGKKFAIITCSVLFSLLLLLEIGLIIYSIRSGTLMGSELIIRPLSETIQTIKASMNILLPITSIILIITLFLLLSLKLQKRKYSDTFLFSFFLFIVIGSSLIFILNLLSKPDIKPAEQNYIINKSWHCIYSCITLKNNSNYLSFKEADFLKFPVEKNTLKEFIFDYPNREIKNYEYPLERSPENIPDVLFPYFRENDTFPNIVLVIVESLGREWSGNIENEISFTPFIDSLAKSGLYWSNCFSTTTRSYGAVPAITASVPTGVKGFQFGIMPKHHSMISILNNNNYQTNAFYGGDFAFDCIYDYLIAENIGYMSPFYQNKKQYQGLTNWWGLYDHAFFNKSMEILNERKHNTPIFNLMITLSSHEKLDLKDKDLQKFYIEKTERIFSLLSKDKQSEFQSNSDYITSIVYVDDCLKNFFSNYQKREDFNNTIFIITGDHATGQNTKNILSYFHVPLLIWSPLIHTPKYFTSVVTHNDITPSVLSLLQHKYQLEMPETIHWIGDGLDTSTSFQEKSKMLILNYTREIKELLYENYYYSKWHPNRILKLDKNLDVEILYDKDIIDKIAQKFNAFKYVNNYVYHNDRLLNTESKSKEKYILIKKYNNNEGIICITPDYKPSEKKNLTYNLFPKTQIPDNDWKKLRIAVSADVYVKDSLWQDQFMDLEFSCTGSNMQYPVRFKDKISKFLSSETMNKETWFKLSMVKKVNVKDAKELELLIKVSTVEYDHEWVSNSTLIIKNVNVLVEGIKDE